MTPKKPWSLEEKHSQGEGVASMSDSTLLKSMERIHTTIDEEYVLNTLKQGLLCEHCGKSDWVPAREAHITAVRGCRQGSGKDPGFGHSGDPASESPKSEEGAPPLCVDAVRSVEDAVQSPMSVSDSHLHRSHLLVTASIGAKTVSPPPVGPIQANKRPRKVSASLSSFEKTTHSKSLVPKSKRKMVLKLPKSIFPEIPDEPKGPSKGRRKVAQLPVYSWDEIKRHNNAESCWIVVNEQVLDITRFIKYHPGGSDGLVRFGGTKCDEHFVMHSSKARKLFMQFSIGRTPDCPTSSQCTIM